MSLISRGPFFTVAVGTAAACAVLPAPDPSAPASAAPTDTIVWFRTFGGAARDVGGSIADAPAGGWLIVGSTQSFGTGRDDIWVLRLTPEGDTLWTRTWGSAVLDRTATGSVTTADDGWVIGGSTSRGPQRRQDIVLIGVDTRGNELWSRYYGSSGYDQLEAINRTSDGGYIIAGATSPPGSAFEGGQPFEVPWVLRIDARGDTLWTRTFPGKGHGMSTAAFEASDGSFILAGSADDGPQYAIDLTVRKLTARGDSVWTWRFGGAASHVWPEWIEETPDGGFVAAGAICEPCAPFLPNNDVRVSTLFDAFVVKLSASGDTVWTRRLGSATRNDLGYFVTVTSKGNYMVGGSTSSHDGPSDSPWLIELSPRGEILWSRILPSAFPRNGVAQIREIAPEEFLVTGPPWLYQRDGSQDLWIMRLKRR